MTARELALARDLVARARLARDPYEQIRRHRPDARYGQHPQMRQPRPLTDREVEVLVWYSRGVERRGVAEMLGVSEQTVKNFTRSACTKLRAKNRTQAACEAIRQGLIP